MKRILLGNEAVARGVYEAGATVASAYPGTPSTEITEAIATYDEIYSEWAPNEKVGMEVAIGASIGGVRAFTAMKHVGLNVAADPLFTASYTGVTGGLVIAVADDPGMHSSQNEQDSRHYAQAAKVPMIEPSDSMEAKEFTKLAFELSEKFDVPVIIRLSTRISHSRSLVSLDERMKVPVKPYKKDEAKFVMMPAMARKRHVIVEQRQRDLEEFCETTELNVIEMKDKKIGVICGGIAYQYAKEALPEASFLKLGMVYPLPKRKIREFAESVDRVIVVEELDPIIETFVKAQGIEVEGKDILSMVGEYSVNQIKDAVAGRPKNVTPPPADIPQRPPVMCPGCSHRGLFYILKKLKMVVTGDIGCYTLGALPPLQAMDTCVCMGAAIGVSLGMEKAAGDVPANKLVAVIGDSTFVHSGITGLVDVVYNKGRSTIIILDNSTTGMTGHQENPTTGFTVKGEPTTSVDLVALAKAIGVKRVSVIDPFDLAQTEKTIREETSADEPSVIIARRPCALLKTVNYHGKVRVNDEACKKCKMCLRIGCPAIVWDNDRICINETLCNGCGLCLEVCKFDALAKDGE